MPCSRSRCSLPKTFTAEDGTKMQTWFSIRKSNLRSMRRMVKRVVLYMALIEAIRIGPDALVMAGKHGFPERGADDFGIAYCAAYMLSWIYLCVFVAIWKVFFSWWVPAAVPSGSETAKSVDKVASWMTQINMVLLPLCIGLSLLEYVFWLGSALVYVDARPVDSWKLPNNTQKNWLARIMLVTGIFVSTTLGYGFFQTLAEYDLAHVKQLEYLIIVLPIQTNIGVLLGSAMQWRMEMRIEKKQAAVKTEENGTVSEKAALLEV